ncbi:MAG: hypothetical protein AAFW00_21445 [Bacteroidota bacterium]
MTQRLFILIPSIQTLSPNLTDWKKEKKMNEEEKRFRFWQKWLTFANIMTIGVGLMAAFAGNSMFFELHNHYTKEIFLDGSEFEQKEGYKLYKYVKDE